MNEHGYYDAGEFGGNCFQKVSCGVCDAEWAECYTPDGIEMISEGNPAELLKAKQALDVARDECANSTNWSVSSPSTNWLRLTTRSED